MIMAWSGTRRSTPVGTQFMACNRGCWHQWCWLLSVFGSFWDVRWGHESRCTLWASGVSCWAAAGGRWLFSGFLHGRLWLLGGDGHDGWSVHQLSSCSKSANSKYCFQVVIYYLFVSVRASIIIFRHLFSFSITQTARYIAHHTFLSVLNPLVLLLQAGRLFTYMYPSAA